MLYDTCHISISVLGLFLSYLVLSCNSLQCSPSSSTIKPPSVNPSIINLGVLLSGSYLRFVGIKVVNLITYESNLMFSKHKSFIHQIMKSFHFCFKSFICGLCIINQTLIDG